MKVFLKHSWDLSITEAKTLQMHLRYQLDLTSPLNFNSIKTIAAADISYARRSQMLFAALVLMGFPNLKVLSVFRSQEKVEFPYIPGLLSFREVPALMAIFQEMEDDFDVLLCDGHGIAHPRRFGLACHLGLLLNKPSVGCAKSRLIGWHNHLPLHKGAFCYLYDGTEPIGVVLRSRAGVKPLFVSPGHKVDIASAMKLVMASVGRYRIPEPLRRAHQQVNRHRMASEKGDSSL